MSRTKNLSQLQQAFSSFLLDNLSGNETDLAVESYVRGTKTFSAQQRLQVYSSGMVAELLGVLEAVYPVCVQLVGERYFRQLARSYLSQYPSENADLNEYGAYFPAHLNEIVRTRPEASSLVYLPDMAQLEWYLEKSYYSADDSTFDFQAFASLPSEKVDSIVFITSHSLFLLRTEYPINQIWCSHREGGDLAVALDSGPECLIVYRERDVPQLSKISEEKFELLSKVKDGLPLQALFDPETTSDSNSSSQSFIPEFIERGWIVGFRVYTPSK